MGFLAISRVQSFLIAVLSYFLSCSLLISMARESMANLLKDGIIWVEGFGHLYICMGLVTFFMIEAELRSSVELLAYSIVQKNYTNRYLHFDLWWKKFEYDEEEDFSINKWWKRAKKSFDYFLILVSVGRLCMVGCIEAMIMVQIFQVDKGTSI